MLNSTLRADVSPLDFLFKHARTLATFSDVPDLRADDKSASVVLEFRASCRSYPRWLRKRSKSGLRKRPPIFLQICWYFLPQLAALMSWAFLTPFLAVLPSLFINLLLNWTTARSKGVDAQAHVAVLYIAGMFCAQMAVSLTRSRSLIMGRRLCIRAKALVITEVFTKALRRKDLAGKALVEGAKGVQDAKAAEPGKEDEGPATAGRIQNLVSVDATRSKSKIKFIVILVASLTLKPWTSRRDVCIYPFLLSRGAIQ